MVRRRGLIGASVASVMIAMTVAPGCGRTDLMLGLDDVADGSTGDEDPTGDGDWVSDTSTGDGDPTTGDGDGDPTTGDGDGDPTTGDGDGDPTTGDGDGDPCMDFDVALTGEPATVVFLIDQGAHMSGNFGGGLTRLEAIGAALFDPMQGVAYAWEDQRRLGLVGFTSVDGELGGECPLLEIAAPDLLAAMSMEGTFSGLAPVDENPVADALTATVPLFEDEPGHVILLTGRNPDTCAQPNPQQGDGEAVLAAQDAFNVGVRTHLVAVGNLTGSYPQDLANAGAGITPQSMDDAPWSTPSNLDALRTGLDDLLQSFASCSLSTSVPLMPGSACTVELDGQTLQFGEPDGWVLTAADQIELTGAACAAYQQGATPTMTCACG